MTNRLDYAVIKKNLPNIVAWFCCLVLFPVSVSSQSPPRDRVDPGPLDQETLDLFAAYPHSSHFDFIVHTHARREPMEKANVALFSTWFLHGNLRVVMTTVVHNDGQVYTYPLPNSEVARTHSRWKKQPDIDMTSLTAGLKSLPVTTSSVALSNLVIVSFHLDGKWHTRLYDRSRPPAELARIYQLVHSLLEVN